MAILVIIPMLLLSLTCLAFWIWMLIDCISNEPKEGNERIVWVVVIAVTQWIGALIYLLYRRPRRIDIYGR